MRYQVPLAGAERNRAHGRDERVGVQSFDENVEYTYRIVKAMGRN
jgi:hypothetical protein